MDMKPYLFGNKISWKSSLIKSFYLSLCISAYVNDDDFVPKNASVVVKRVPANAKNSLLSRLNNRGPAFHHTPAM